MMYKEQTHLLIKEDKPILNYIQQKFQVLLELEQMIKMGSNICSIWGIFSTILGVAYFLNKINNSIIYQIIVFIWLALMTIGLFIGYMIIKQLFKLDMWDCEHDYFNRTLIAVRCFAIVTYIFSWIFGKIIFWLFLWWFYKLIKYYNNYDSYNFENKATHIVLSKEIKLEILKKFKKYINYSFIPSFLLIIFVILFCFLSFKTSYNINHINNSSNLILLIGEYSLKYLFMTIAFLLLIVASIIGIFALVELLSIYNNSNNIGNLSKAKFLSIVGIILSFCPLGSILFLISYKILKKDFKKTKN